MASLIRRTNGTYEIRFGKPRQAIYLGERSKRNANLWRSHVEHLIDQDLAPPCRATRDWLASLSDADHRRLADKGLVEPREQQERQTVAGLVAVWMRHKERTTKPSSVEVYRKTANCLVKFFGRKRVDRVTPRDADEFYRWLLREGNQRRGGGLAPTTATKRMEVARDIFSGVDKNPFAKQRHWQFRESNPERSVEVKAEWVRRILDACPDNEWRLIVSLSRWAGLRVPSEVLCLSWSDVLWDQGRMWIASPKTGRRLIPIWPEVSPFLREAWEAAPDGERRVIREHRYENRVNYWGHLEQFCYRAGIMRWPRLWHNMRATRETELMRYFPVHVVCAWLGNSPRVAVQHYLQVQDADFERAIGVGESPQRQRVPK